VVSGRVKYLLDTQAWVWAVLDHPRLSRRTRTVLSAANPHDRLGLAAISLKEAAWHLSHGRIDVAPGAGPWPLWLRSARLPP
jgi:PIN domain nuclease of toxin-antitoxin system